MFELAWLFQHGLKEEPAEENLDRANTLPFI